MSRVRLSGWRMLSLAFVLGAVAALGQAPLGFWWATLAGLAGLVWLVDRAPGRKGAFLAGLAAGIGYFALALSWIVEPFLIDAARHGWMIPFVVVLLSACLGFFWGAAALFAKTTKQPILWFVVAFVFLEWERGIALTGFPWAMVGHVWIGIAVDQVASVLGPSGLDLLTLGLAALPVAFRWKGVAASGLVLAMAFGFGTWRLSQPMPADRDGVVRLVQPNADQSAKWDAALAESFLDRLLTLTAEGEPADLTIWPETSVPYMLEYAPEVAGMVGAASSGKLVAAGIQREDEGRFYNSLRFLEGTGEERTRYDKAHLVPFGEYIPLGDLAYDWFGITAFAAQAGRTYSAGTGPAVIDLGPLGKVLPLICYEAIFPRDVNAAPERADWILQVTNDAWFGVRTGPFQHFALARLRAIEQGLPMIRVANTGMTAVIDARGRVVVDLPFGTMGKLDTSIPGALPPTPYSRFGDAPVLLLLGALALLSVFLRPNAR